MARRLKFIGSMKCNLVYSYRNSFAVLMLLTLVTLWLDPRSIERMSLAFVNLILHILCVSNLHWALPHNGSAIPNICE